MNQTWDPKNRARKRKHVECDGAEINAEDEEPFENRQPQGQFEKRRSTNERRKKLIVSLMNLNLWDLPAETADLHVVIDEIMDGKVTFDDAVLMKRLEKPRK